ncbi:membrane protein YqaA, SNARE-associated domain [Tranquillimonas rosea]|uniref:Membrane protein YqaA, SNARE-associated domain n=1 Tax=Tranquillimonas rosea TaxID=641238 RepID=A0A1H9U560_9RHOB|nr:YqaA family protein [Tranquillimonas rosea]SES04509.1 membrane protein YqaA, SNARE-associated domain [Tranquillimonas rosea]
MTGAPSLIGLFLAALGAATILPFQSEVVFAALQAAGRAPVWLLVVVASVGNTIGSVITYLMGRGIERFRHRRWFPFTERQIDRAQTWYRRWGLWSLLLTWAPFGDAIALAAGLLRTPPGIFVLLVAIAKTGRYIVLALITAGLIG